jgi:hypothetical protein
MKQSNGKRYTYLIGFILFITVLQFVQIASIRIPSIPVSMSPTVISIYVSSAILLPLILLFFIYVPVMFTIRLALSFNCMIPCKLPAISITSYVASKVVTYYKKSLQRLCVMRC